MTYPHMFRAADLVIRNKIDPLPYVDFDMTPAPGHLRAVNPALATPARSVRTGEGLAEWYDWLRRQLAAARDAAFA